MLTAPHLTGKNEEKLGVENCRIITFFCYSGSTETSEAYRRAEEDQKLKYNTFSPLVAMGTGENTKD